MKVFPHSAQCVARQWIHVHASVYGGSWEKCLRIIQVKVVSGPEVDSCIVPQIRGDFLSGVFSAPDNPESSDADHVCDVQRARHVRGDPACLVFVRFGTHDRAS